jgi:hypothetical protein
VRAKSARTVPSSGESKTSRTTRVYRILRMLQIGNTSTLLKMSSRPQLSKRWTNISVMRTLHPPTVVAVPIHFLPAQREGVDRQAKRNFRLIRDFRILSAKRLSGPLAAVAVAVHLYGPGRSGAMLVGISSPYHRAGLLYRKWKAHYGHRGLRQDSEFFGQ